MNMFFKIMNMFLSKRSDVCAVLQNGETLSAQMWYGRRGAEIIMAGSRKYDIMTETS